MSNNCRLECLAVDFSPFDLTFAMNLLFTTFNPAFASGPETGLAAEGVSLPAGSNQSPGLPKAMQAANGRPAP
ncbi:hypothetical protein, partial [Corynebacterium sp.]|uniref:hypothetical protein n=1 Tax=Corynebacterium sp. TaxID=1720 RepID=UPI00257DADAD